MKQIALYMAGSIQKGHETGNELFWTDLYLNQLESHLQPLSVSFLNPAHRTDDLSDQKSVFGRDMTQVFSCDFVVVDARARRGLGVGAEMMWAKFHKIPVVTWAPKETHYHKGETSILGVPVQNFIHPFVESLSDHVAESLEDIATFIKKALSNPTFTPKGIDCIHSAMQHFITKGLAEDLPMQEILASNPYVKGKVASCVTK